MKNVGVSENDNQLNKVLENLVTLRAINFEEKMEKIHNLEDLNREFKATKDTAEV